jgi:hypothetical protein
MKQIRGYCHRVCNECTIFQATLHDDDRERTYIAATLSEVYDKQIRPEDIHCDGCTTKDGRLFMLARDCSARMSAVKKS